MENLFYTLTAGGHKVFFSKRMVPCVSDVKTFRFKPDDVVISSYPKTGSMWVSEMAWQLMHPNETASATLMMRAPLLEMGVVPEFGINTTGLQMLQEMPSPRLFKTHLMPEFLCDDWLESGAKFVLVTRNPKDTLVSYFHFIKSLEASEFSGSWEEFYAMFEEKNYLYGDFFDFYNSWWRFHTHPNVMIISYEELKQNHEKGGHRLGDFLKGGVSDEVVGRIVNATNIEALRANKKFSETYKTLDTTDAFQFIRKGIVGDWKNYFTPEQNEYVEKLYMEKLEPLGLKFKFEI